MTSLHAASEQLALLEPAPQKLTPRQDVVLDALARNGQDGLTADEAGALWHALKDTHHHDDRCLHCGHTGKEILEALKAKGLATYRRANRARSIPGAWLATNLTADAEADTSLPRGMTDEIPY